MPGYRTDQPPTTAPLPGKTGALGHTHEGPQEATAREKSAARKRDLEGQVGAAALARAVTSLGHEVLSVDQELYSQLKQQHS